MVWNLGAVFVLAMTAGNLIPRALYTHKWFHKNFDDYPKTEGGYPRATLKQASETTAAQSSIADASGLVPNSRADRPLLNGYWLHGLHAQLQGVIGRPSRVGISRTRR